MRLWWQGFLSHRLAVSMEEFASQPYPCFPGAAWTAEVLIRPTIIDRPYRAPKNLRGQCRVERQHHGIVGVGPALDRSAFTYSAPRLLAAFLALLASVA